MWWQTKICLRISKEEKARAQPTTKVYFGKVVNLWIETKETVSMKTDVLFAKCLLDRSANPVYLTFQIR